MATGLRSGAIQPRASARLDRAVLDRDHRHGPADARIL
jgi:hypothetical protein